MLYLPEAVHVITLTIRMSTENDPESSQFNRRNSNPKSDKKSPSKFERLFRFWSVLLRGQERCDLSRHALHEQAWRSLTGARPYAPYQASSSRGEGL